jgi:hypothetical protein
VTSNPSFQHRPLAWSDYQRTACDADVALWAPRDPAGEVIAWATGGPFCHATGIVHWFGQICSAGYEEHRNGFGAPLERAVADHPGKIAIFRCPALGHRLKETGEVSRRLVEDLDGVYQWRNIRLIALSHTLLGRAFLTRTTWYQSLALRQSLKTKSAICSQHVHRSFREGARITLVPHKRESLVTPNDLASSSQLIYLGTLEGA